MLHAKFHTAIKTLFSQSDPELANFDPNNKRDSIVAQADLVIADVDASQQARSAAQIVKNCLPDAP